MDRLSEIALDAYDRMFGLELGDLARRSPVDCGKRGLKRSMVAVAAQTNRHDSSLFPPMLDALVALGGIPPGATVHLERGYDSAPTRERLAERGLEGEIATKGKPAPIAASRLAGQADECLNQRPQETRLVHRATRDGRRLLARLLGGAYRRRSAGPRRLAAIPPTRPPSTPAMTNWHKLFVFR